MQQAIALATENVLSGRGGPFGAVIVRDGEVLATGVNLVTATTTPPPTPRSSPSAAPALSLGNFQLNGCEIYTSCEPCPMCLAADLLGALRRHLLRQHRRRRSRRPASTTPFSTTRSERLVDQRSIPTTNLLRDQASPASTHGASTPAESTTNSWQRRSQEKITRKSFQEQTTRRHP